MKYAIINQPAGLGDIFYLQKISKLLSKNNFNIIWPVISQFSYIKDYIKETNITFVSEKEDFKYKNIYLKNYNQLIQETHGDDIILSIPFVHVLMKQKYPMLNLTGFEKSIISLIPTQCQLLKNFVIYCKLCGISNNKKNINFCIYIFLYFIFKFVTRTN